MTGTGEVTVRLAEDADFAALASVVAEPEVLEWWGPHDEERLRTDARDEDVIVWTVLRDGEIAGLVQVTQELEPDYRNAEIDLFVHPPGQGIGSRALRAVIEILIDDYGHRRLLIAPSVGNARAIRCYESVGFRRVGVVREAFRLHGVWHDDLLMEMLTREYERA